MKNSLIGVVIAALVGALAGLIGASSGIPLLGGAGGVGKKMVHATINLDRVGGDCRISTDPQTLEAFKKETIEWTIVDRCGETVSADVHIVFPEADDPLDEACARSGKKKIKCALKNAVDFKSYKYEVRAGGAVPEDPELEIVR